MTRWLVFSALILLTASCVRQVEQQPYHLQNDAYLIVVKPCSYPSRHALVPVNSGFYERTTANENGYDIVIFPTPEEFFNKPAKWKSWRFIYPLAAGMYRLVDLIPGGTAYRPTGFTLVEEDGIIYRVYDKIILAEGPYEGLCVEMQYLNDHVELPEQVRDPNLEIGYWEPPAPFVDECFVEGEWEFVN